MILMSPDWEIKISSSLRSMGQKEVQERDESQPKAKQTVKQLLTPMHNIIFMTIIQCAANLPGEPPGDPLLQAAMGYNIIEHLPTLHVLENQVVVVLMSDHLAHAANMRVVEEERDGGFVSYTGFLFRSGGR